MDSEEAIAISKAAYMAGVLDERNEWYKKIRKKIEELEEVLGFVKTGKDTISQAQASLLEKIIKFLKELIGKKE